MRSWKLCWFCLLVLLPLLLFGESHGLNRLLNEVADEATSQVSTPSVSKSVTPQAATDNKELESMADLRPFVERYYAAYANRDVEALMALWNSHSPEIGPQREALQKFFATNDHIVVNNIEIKQARIEEDRARLRVAVEVSATD